MSPAALQVNDLGVTFGSGAEQIQAVKSASFAIAEGESYGIIGESGSGKSTILRAISGLDTNYTGSVQLDGHEAPVPRDRPFFTRVQMVFQDPYGSLHPRRMVRAILAEPLSIFGMGDAEVRISRLLTEVGLSPDFAYRYPHQLSGGQRQRVAVARALILEPRILLLDEPTSSLDVSVQAGVLNLLSDLRERHGLTYVLVSHDLRVIAHMCNRLAVMTGGKIVEELSVEDFRARNARQDYTKRLIAASTAEAT